MGVKSFGCEKSTHQAPPIQSWKRIEPCVVCASKSGAVSPICKAMIVSRLFRCCPHNWLTCSFIHVVTTWSIWECCSIDSLLRPLRNLFMTRVEAKLQAQRRAEYHRSLRGPLRHACSVDAFS